MRAFRAQWVFSRIAVLKGDCWIDRSIQRNVQNALWRTASVTLWNSPEAVRRIALNWLKVRVLSSLTVKLSVRRGGQHIICWFRRKEDFPLMHTVDFDGEYTWKNGIPSPHELRLLWNRIDSWRVDYLKNAYIHRELYLSLQFFWRLKGHRGGEAYNGVQRLGILKNQWPNEVIHDY